MKSQWCWIWSLALIASLAGTSAGQDGERLDLTGSWTGMDGQEAVVFGDRQEGKEHDTYTVEFLGSNAPPPMEATFDGVRLTTTFVPEPKPKPSTYLGATQLLEGPIQDDKPSTLPVKEPEPEQGTYHFYPQGNLDRFVATATQLGGPEPIQSFFRQANGAACITGPDELFVTSSGKVLERVGFLIVNSSTGEKVPLYREQNSIFRAWIHGEEAVTPEVRVDGKPLKTNGNFYASSAVQLATGKGELPGKITIEVRDPNDPNRSVEKTVELINVEARDYQLTPEFTALQEAFNERYWEALNRQLGLGAKGDVDLVKGLYELGVKSGADVIKEPIGEIAFEVWDELRRGREYKQAQRLRGIYDDILNELQDGFWLDLGTSVLSQLPKRDYLSADDRKLVTILRGVLVLAERIPIPSVKLAAEIAQVIADLVEFVGSVAVQYFERKYTGAGNLAIVEQAADSNRSAYEELARLYEGIDRVWREHLILTRSDQAIVAAEVQRRHEGIDEMRDLASKKVLALAGPVAPLWQDPKSGEWYYDGESRDARDRFDWLKSIRFFPFDEVFRIEDHPAFDPIYGRKVKKGERPGSHHIQIQSGTTDLLGFAEIELLTTDQIGQLISAHYRATYPWPTGAWTLEFLLAEIKKRLAGLESVDR